MPNGLSRAALFVSAYSPLLVLFAILGSFGPTWTDLVLVGTAVISVLLSLAHWRVSLRQLPTWLETTHTRNRDIDVLSFFVTYVVPFAAAPLADTRSRIALLFFLGVVAALYVRAGTFHVHPLLLIAGYHLFEVETDGGRFITILTRDSVLPQVGKVRVVPLVTNVYVDRGTE